jgi:hypothetical protein
MFLEHNTRAILTKEETDNLPSLSSSAVHRQPGPSTMAAEELSGTSHAKVNASLRSGCRVELLTILASSILLSGSACEARLNLSYSAGTLDAANQFMGGTEMRSLVPHAGKLFAGNGYWEDQPGPEGYQNTQALVLSQAAYFGGFDANGAPTHNTAWIARYSPATPAN